MPKQGGHWGGIDKPLDWFPRLSREDDDNTVLAPAGEKAFARRELEGGDCVCMVVERHLKFVPGDGH